MGEKTNHMKKSHCWLGIGAMTRGRLHGHLHANTSANKHDPLVVALQVHFVFSLLQLLRVLGRLDLQQIIHVNGRQVAIPLDF
jgi:hypothetical protein